MMDLSMVNSSGEYKNLLSSDEECGGSVELTCISRLSFNYLFRVHYENSSNAVDYGCMYCIACVSFHIKNNYSNISYFVKNEYLF